MHEGPAFHLHRSVVSGRHRAGLARQERGEVTRDSGVLCIGQGHLREARPTRALRQVGHGRLWKKTVSQDANQFFAT